MSVFLRRNFFHSTSVTFFGGKFNLIFITNQTSKLKELFVDFQLMNDTDILKSMCGNSQIIDNDDKTYFRMDVILAYMSNLKTCTGQPKYNLLFNVARLVILLPHSNAGGKRVAA